MTSEHIVEPEMVFVVCSCGQKHRLFPSISAPCYWCGNELRKLVAGDTVEYDNGDTGTLRYGRT